jgi:hypothetical protein
MKKILALALVLVLSALPVQADVVCQSFSSCAYLNPIFAGTLTAGTGAATFGGTVTVTGLATFNGGATIASNTFNLRRATLSGASAPACAAASGWGSSPSCAVDTGSSDTAGIITVTVGGTPGTSGTSTVTFSAALGTNNPACVVSLMDGSTAWNAAATTKVVTSTTTVLTIAWNNTAAPGAGTLKHSYVCFGK